MISFINHKEPERVIKNAVLDDISPADKGTVIEYWQGETDTNPTGKRGSVFRTVMALADKGRAIPYQVRIGGEVYSYRFKVV